MPRLLLIVSIALFGLGLACESPRPEVRRDPEGTKTEKKDASPSPAPTATQATPGLRLVLDPSPLVLDGHVLTLGMTMEDLTRAIGEPTRSTDYGPGEGAMSNTTYLSYGNDGFVVRTKNDKVEGFFVYLKDLEIEDAAIHAAKPRLPGDLPLDATTADVEAVLGKPARREVVEEMSWVDLHYTRPAVLWKFHFDHDVLRSVSLEVPWITAKGDAD